MGLKEEFINRINALALNNTAISVHTISGEVGRVKKTSFLKGTITVDANIFQGKDVAPLDELLPGV